MQTINKDVKQNWA